MPTKLTYARTIDEPRLPAVHPGQIIAEAIEEGLGMRVGEAARQLGISRQQLHNVLTGRASVTPEMALRIGRLLGNGPNIWLALQARYDLAQASQRLAHELERIPQPAA